MRIDQNYIVLENDTTQLALSTQLDHNAVDCLLGLTNHVPTDQYAQVFELVLSSFDCTYAETIGKQLDKMFWDGDIELNEPKTIITVIRQTNIETIE